MDTILETLVIVMLYAGFFLWVYSQTGWFGVAAVGGTRIAD